MSSTGQLARKIFGTVAALSLGIGAFAAGSIAGFRTDASARVAPSPRIELTSSGPLDVAGLVSGDRVERTVTIRGVTDAAGLWFKMSFANIEGSHAPGLHGLRARVDRCSVPWTARASHYTCGAARSTIIAPTSARTMSARLPRLAARARAFLRITLSMAADAGNELQGRATKITYTVSALR